MKYWSSQHNYASPAPPSTPKSFSHDGQNELPPVVPQARSVTTLYKSFGGLFQCLTPNTEREPPSPPQQNPTRGHETKLLVPHSKTKIHKNSFFPSAIRLWNNIPPHAPAAALGVCSGCRLPAPGLQIHPQTVNVAVVSLVQRLWVHLIEAWLRND